MRQRISVCNIAVDDLGRARRFYEGMGFEARPESSDRAVFFQLETSWLALFTKPVLAEIAGTPAEPRGEPAFCFSYFVRERDDVDAILAQAVEHGGSVAIEPHGLLRRPGRLPLGDLLPALLARAGGLAAWPPSRAGRSRLACRANRVAVSRARRAAGARQRWACCGRRDRRLSRRRRAPARRARR